MNSIKAPRRPAQYRSGKVTNLRPKLMRLATTSLLAVVVALIFTAGSAEAATKAPTPAPAASSAVNRVTFGLEPASSKGGDGRPYLSYGATPGATLSDYVAAVNYSAQSLTLQVYATDALETTGGGFGLLPQDVKPTEVGAWIAIPPKYATVTVPPQGSKGPGEVVIPIELRVPRSATPGDHSGGIVVQLGTLGKNSTGQDIELEQRVGTRIFVRVSGPTRPRLVLTVIRSGYHGVLNPVGEGKVVVGYKIANTGNINLGFKQSVTFSPLIGSARKVTLSKVDLLLPGSQVTENVAIPHVFPEFLDSRSISIIPLLLTGEGGPDAPVVTSQAIVWAIPWSLIVTILLAITALYVRSRFRKKSEDEDGPEGSGGTSDDSDGSAEVAATGTSTKPPGEVDVSAVEDDEKVAT